jgi:hypothetical protein
LISAADRGNMTPSCLQLSLVFLPLDGAGILAE